jgi:type III restriction enzyme
MKIVLKDFQTDAVDDLRSKFDLMVRTVDDELSAVLLNAPTGSGKTLMATALIEQLLAGSEESGQGGDPDLTFLWLTDQPELNLQTCSKMLATSTVLDETSLVVIDSSFDAERLAPGKVYFLNTQKLGGGGKTYNTTGDARTFTLWETLTNTVAADPSKFVLFLDEAHRGAKGAEASEAETIMQKFLKGNGSVPAVPLVVGISATPKRFVDLCEATNRTLRRVNVPPAEVRASGLLKEYVDLFHPDETQPSDVTMLEAAIGSWKSYCEQWSAYTVAADERPVSPVLLVQVADAKAKSFAYSETDLSMVLSTLRQLVPHEGDAGDLSWLAHAFQDGGDITVDNVSIRHLAPSEIDADPAVKVVLFKTSLNTGWDCPRAETMVSFRSAKEEDNIAQLVGRMVRTPLARLVDGNEHLNTVALYLPYYDQAAVRRVIARLSDDPDSVPPTKGREGKEAVTLHRAKNKDACFAKLASLTSYTVPRTRTIKPVPRVARLAALLAELGWEDEPVKAYRAALVDVLLDELKTKQGDKDFKTLMDEAAVLDVRRRRHNYGMEVDTDEEGTSVRTRVRIADQNIQDLYNQCGRLLGEGLHLEYLRARLDADSKLPPKQVKLELYALLSTPGVLDLINAEADRIRKEWVNAHKASLPHVDEKSRQTWLSIEASGQSPEPFTLAPPLSIETTKATTAWPGHLFVDADGKYHEDFRSSWESRVVKAETSREDFVAWLRNPDRKPWSLCVARQDGTKWVGVYPDFIFFRSTKGGVIADIVDPHLLNDQYAPARAAALAHYAEVHKNDFGRIDLVIFESPSDEQGKRIDLVDDAQRAKVSKVTTHEHLKALFDQM